MKLGKLPRRSDPRTLSARKYLLTPLPTAKPMCDWLSVVPSFPMYGNDVHGDCAIAAIGHMVQVWTANNKTPVVPSQDEILRVYKILSPNDDGCVLLDVLNYWRQNPICGIKVGAFAEVNPQDLDEVKVCLDIFGGLYAGAMLPIAAQAQDIWDVVSGADGDIGSWGGHSFPYGQYNPAKTGVVTWGEKKYSTWAWNAKYVDELYALISPDWFGAAGKTPEGLDLETLEADLRLVTEA
jgi:hypothetical protein